MTKVVLVFAMMLNGSVVQVRDDDGPNEFPTYRACVLYAIKRKALLTEILRDNLLTEPLYWRCVR